MSLREEIEEIVHDHLLTYSEDVMIDDIIKTINKRIDVLHQEYENKIKTENNHNQWNQDVGASLVLERLKELLK